MEILAGSGVVEISVVHCQAPPGGKKGGEDGVLRQCGQALYGLPVTQLMLLAPILVIDAV